MKSLENIDLNLLLLLHWLIVEKSVTRAGQRVGLSQPAASRALGRLRQIFGDELLAQTGRTLVPTQLAAKLAPDLETAIGQMRRAISVSTKLDPEAFEGSVSFASNDYLSSIVSHMWMKDISTSAINLDASWRPLDATVIKDAVSGQIDFVLAPDAARAAFPKTSVMEDMVIKPFLSDKFVLFGTKTHPVFQLRRLDTAVMATLDYVMVSPTGRGSGIIDEVLAKDNLSRRIGHRTGSFLHAAELAVSTNCVAVLPARLAKTYAQGTFRDLPFKTEGISSFMAWHSSRTKDPVHKWVRQQLLASQ